MQSFAKAIMSTRAANSSFESLQPVSLGLSTRKIWSRCLLFAIATMAILGATEIGLREIAGLGHPILYELNPAFGYFPQPNQFTRRLFARTFTNRFGMRSPEFTLEKAPGTLRLMFLGDSITYGTTQVDQDDIFVERVGKDLSSELHRRVEDFNASASGWAISNEDGFLHSCGTYNSDYIVLVLNSGDLDQPFSSFADVAGGQTTSPGSAIGELFLRLFPFRQGSPQHDAGTTVGNDPATERANVQELSDMAQFARAHGSKFLLVFIPFRREIAPGARFSAQPALKKWADTEAVDFFDLTGAVSAYETKAVTLRDHVHYNVLGNRLLAEALEKSFAEEFAAHR
jgi:hypothetical protein